MAHYLCCVLDKALECLRCGLSYCSEHISTLEGSGSHGKGGTGDRGFVVCDCGARGSARWKSSIGIVPIV